MLRLDTRTLAAIDAVLSADSLVTLGLARQLVAQIRLLRDHLARNLSENWMEIHEQREAIAFLQESMGHDDAARLLAAAGVLVPRPSAPPKPLVNYRTRICHYLQEHGEQTATQLQISVEGDWNAIGAALADLITEGVVIHNPEADTYALRPS